MTATPMRCAGVLTIVALLVALTYGRFTDIGLLGFDTYTTIAAARIQSLGDLTGTFTEELMDGRFRFGGHFYRPVVNLTFAADYAAYGLEGRGYIVTNLVILVMGAGALLCATLRLLGPRGLLPGAFAALVYALHPLQLEIFPVAPRRADSLSLAFVLLALAATPRAASGRARGLLAGALALLAVGSKESGVIVLPLVLALTFLEANGESLGARALSAARRAGGVLSAVPAFFLVRAIVLGGMGGNPDSSLAGLLHLHEVLVPYSALTLLPDRSGVDATLVMTLLGALVAAGILSCGLAEREVRDAQRRAVVVTGVLLVVITAITSFSGRRVEAWYALLFVGPYALGLGLLVRAGLERGSTWRRVGLLALPLALVANHIARGPWFHAYAEWHQGAELSRAYLERFDGEVGRGRDGTSILVDRMPLFVPPPPEGPGVRRVVLLNTWSLAAYAELKWPERSVRVHAVDGDQDPRKTEAGVLKVFVTPRDMRPPRRSPDGQPEQGQRR